MLYRPFICYIDPLVSTYSAVLNQFEPVSLANLAEIVMKLKPSYCPTDIVPPRLFKEAWETIGPTVQKIINSSLVSGDVPTYLKEAVLNP